MMRLFRAKKCQKTTEQWDFEQKKSFRKGRKALSKSKLCSVDFAGTKATCADVNFFNATGRSVDFDFLNVRRPAASCLSI